MQRAGRDVTRSLLGTDAAISQEAALLQDGMQCQQSSPGE
jgi:hypothetical protein